MNISTDKMLFISWAPYSRRSETLAKEMRITSHFVHYLKYQQPTFAPFKYILQFLKTVLLILTKRPGLVFVQEPPVFACLAVYICRILALGRIRYIIDAHSGAFHHPWWKPFRRIPWQLVDGRLVPTKRK